MTFLGSEIPRGPLSTFHSADGFRHQIAIGALISKSWKKEPKTMGPGSSYKWSYGAPDPENKRATGVISPYL